MKLLTMVFLSALLGCGTAIAGTCDAVMNGQLKGLTVPTRVVNTDEMNGQTFTFENIVADGIIYTHKKDGNWKSEKQSANETSIRKAWADNDRCQPDGAGDVDGEPADIVAEHTIVVGMTMDTQFWISQKSGQILKSRTVMSNGVLTARYYYDNVQVPSGDKPVPAP